MKRCHPDVNQESPEARSRIQELNAAYEVLSDAARRRAYDRELDQASRNSAVGRTAKLERNIKQEVRLRIADFFKGATLEVQVRDPGNAGEVETYQLHVPSDTAPRARFRIPREDGGFVEIRLKALPSGRFKIRGDNLCCDLRISARRAAEGGRDMVERPSGGALPVSVPVAAKRGEIIRIPNEGLPKIRGGRGDLLVRVVYRPEVRVTRTR